MGEIREYLNPLKLLYKWSGRQDLNLRPLDPQSSALPDCATPRFYFLSSCKISSRSCRISLESKPLLFPSEALESKLFFAPDTVSPSV